MEQLVSSGVHYQRVNSSCSLLLGHVCRPTKGRWAARPALHALAGALLRTMLTWRYMHAVQRLALQVCH